VTIGAFVFALGVAVFISNFFWSLRSGADAGPNPWDAPTLEWATPSPPPPYNFARIPIVASRHPLWEDRINEGTGRSVFDTGPTLDRGRDTFGTGPLDAEVEGILRMPEDTAWPFLVSLSILAVSYGLLASLVWLDVVGALGLFVCIVGWVVPRHEPPATREA